MSSRINKVKNGDFVLGKDTPRHWTWDSRSDAVSTTVSATPRRKKTGGVAVTSKALTGSGRWVQIVAVSPHQYYRVEARITCDLQASNDRDGCVLSVCPVMDGKNSDQRQQTAGIHQSTAPIEIRAYFLAPEGVRQVELSIGLTRARGTLHIQEVRLIKILEPDADSHVHAVPPPRHELLKAECPKTIRSVCVSSQAGVDRKIVQPLTTCFGKRKVDVCDPGSLADQKLACDALLLPDPTPPKSIRSLAALTKLASNRIVVISLPAFATLSRGALMVRKIEQEDDPIHAKVVFGNYATAGFALHDAFPYAWSGDSPGTFVQNHYRHNAAAKAFLTKNGMDALLFSECDQDATSDQPMCLYKRTEKGAIFVLDIEPLETPASTFGETNVGMHFLLSALGQPIDGLGQYIVPFDTEGDFRRAIREMHLRFGPFVVHDRDIPADEVTEQIVTIGREDQTFGLPVAPKPAVIIRSGLTAGDFESVYGAWLWFKQLIRMSPFPCPYAESLASRFRLAWVPLAADWEPCRGWRRSASQPDRPTEIDTDDAQVTALIDVVSRPVNEMRVVVSDQGGAADRLREWLPHLMRSFSTVGLQYSTPQGQSFVDRDAFAWQRSPVEVSVDVDPELFGSLPCSDVVQQGGQAIQIQVPGTSGDFSACSIHRTNAAALLIEHTVGLLYGLIAVNRTTRSINFDGFGTIKPGDALIVGEADSLLRSSGSRAG